MTRPNAVWVVSEGAPLQNLKVVPSGHHAAVALFSTTSIIKIYLGGRGGRRAWAGVTYEKRMPGVCFFYTKVFTRHGPI